MKGAGPKGALLPSPGEEWGKEPALLGANHSRGLSPPDQGVLAHSTSRFTLPCMGQQLPNSIHVSQVIPKHLFLLRKEPYSDSNYILTLVSDALFFLDPLDWHRNHSLRFESTHQKMCVSSYQRDDANTNSAFAPCWNSKAISWILKWKVCKNPQWNNTLTKSNFKSSALMQRIATNKGISVSILKVFYM